MKQDPSRGGGSTLSPAYSAALERLAKKRLIGDAPSNNGRAVGDAPLDELPQIGNAPPGKRSVIGGTGKGGLGIVGDALNMAKGIVLSPVATVADIAWKPFEAIPGAPDFNPEDAGTFNIFVQGGKSLQHVYGDVKELGRSIITGEDTLSESPSAKAYQAAGGGLEGALMAAAPYLDVGSVVAPMAMGAARGAGLVAPKPVPYTPLTVADLNVARETFGAPTNAYRTTRNALAEDMAQAQVPRPTVTPAAISPRLEVPTIAPTVPDMPPGFPLPEVPSNMTLLDFQRMPEYQAYIEAGRSIDPRAMAGFAFDPETAYLVHSGRGQLIGGKLDPHRTISSLNEGHLMGVMRGHDSAVLASESLQDALDTFVRTGVWNGDELARRMPQGYSSEGGKFPLKGVVKASDMTDEQLQAFVNTIQERINRHIDFVSQARPYLSLARREPFMSYYPAPVGAREGYMRWHSGPEGGGMYLAGVPADRATTLFGPGIYEKRLGVPEWQAFGAQTPIAGITGFPTQWGYGQFVDEMDAITRAFAVQKTIEDRIRRGFYGRAEGRRLIPEVTAPQTGRTMNPVEELAAAQAQQNVVPLFPEQPPSPSRLRVTNAKLGQSDVADLASYREARDPTLRRFNKNAGDDLYPVGTQFLGKPGAPGRNEAMRKFNAFSRVYEFKFDPEDGIDIEDFIKEGVSAENYDLFTGLLSRAESYKIPRSEQFKVALANFVQRMGGDAVIVNDELILVPRGKTFKDYLAEDEFGLSAIDITPTNRRTMNPVEELASAKARAETAPVVRDIAAEGTTMNDPYVFNVGGERIVFGPPELDISSVKAGPNGVRVVPIDPYELSNLKMGTEAGDKIADDFTIAMGVDREMAPALLYAGSRGNKSAMAQFEQLVETGRAEMKQRRAMVNSKPEIPDEVWASTAPEVMVDTGRTVRPANIDDLFLVHETAYAPPTNQAGDVVLSPSSEFGPYGRDTVHFSLNHVVTQNEGRIFSGDNRYIVIVPLRDALDANPGSLDNLLWGDTFLTPKPGRGLTLPRRSVKVLTNPDADQVSKTLSQVAAAHNKSSGYKVLTAEEVGGHTSEGLSARISYLADRVIPNEYDEYVSEIGSARHVAHPMWNKQASFESVSTVAPVLQELLSPNSRMQYFRGLKRYLGRAVSEMGGWS